LELLADTQSPSIILIEDIDCATTRKAKASIQKKKGSVEDEKSIDDAEQVIAKMNEMEERVSAVTLSGLLNAIGKCI